MTTESASHADRARLLARRDVGGGLALLHLEPPLELCASHQTPGQYVEISIGDVDGFFVLASEVGARAWEILLRAGGDAADALMVLPVGSEVGVTSAMGSGFPMDEARGRSLLVAVAGTGIAAARSILASRMRDGDASRTELFCGARWLREVALASEIEAWATRGVTCTLCLSREDAPAIDEPIHAARGYVQDVARARLKALHGGMIFTVGPEPMVAAMRTLAAELGVREADVRTNY